MVETLSPGYEYIGTYTYGPEISPSNDSREVIKTDDLTSILGDDFKNSIKARILELKIPLPNGMPGFLEKLDIHNGSKAKYLLDNYRNIKEGTKKEKDRILISYIPPFSETSTHYHIEGMVEEYYLLAGELNLYTQDINLIGKEEISNEETIPREGLIVLPGTVHRAKTGEQGALTLIVMRNAAFVDESKHHISVPSL